MGSGRLLCTVLDEQNRGGRKMFVTRANSAAAEHLLSPFSSPFFRVKWLYDYGFRWGTVPGWKPVVHYHLDPFSTATSKHDVLNALEELHASDFLFHR